MAGAVLLPRWKPAKACLFPARITMKNLLWVSAAMLPLLAWPADVSGQVSVGCGVQPNFNCSIGNPYGGGNGKVPAGPWYLYWPLEAHFRTPPPGWPPFPAAPMTLPPGFGQPVPMAGPALVPPAPMVPAYPPVPAPPGPPPNTIMPPLPVPAPPAPSPALPSRNQPVGYWTPQVPSYWYGR
jgi:hypothetical protein